MYYPSSDSKLFQPLRPPQMLSTPTNISQYSSVPKTFTVKDLSETKVTDNKYIINKKNSLETASSGSSNSTASSMSNMAIKTDFISKEKNYQCTIEKLQKRIEALTIENKKLNENGATRSSCVINKSLDEKEQLCNMFEEKERALQKKIDKLLEENSNLIQEINVKASEIQGLEKKLIFTSNEEDRNRIESLTSQIHQIQMENQGYVLKLSEKDKKYEELEENYKQKLSQFKKEISTIKAQQKESSIKDIAESTAPLNVRIKDLEESLRRKTDEVNDLTNKLHRRSNISINLDKEDPKTPCGMMGSTLRINSNKTSEHVRLGYEGQRDSKYNLSQGLIKCNWEEFEKKITSLVDENDKFAENYANGENVNWKKKYMELEDKMLENGGKDDTLRELLQKTKKENEDLKKNASNLTFENTNVNGKLVEIERKLDNLSRENKEELRKKEEEFRMNFEQTLNRLEEQKEKNLMKISKENHELKQNNDELKQQIETLQKQRQINSNSSSNTNINEGAVKKNNEKQPLAQNSSPILIINEMMTPSAKNLLEKNNKDNNKNGNLATVIEAKDENVFNFTKNKKNSNENVKKTYFSNTNLNTNVINLQPQETLKPFNKTHNSRESQEFPSNKYITKNYGVPMNNNNNTKENHTNNNSKEVSKENNLKDSNMSFKDLVNESGKMSEVKNETNSVKNNEKFDFLSHKSDFKQGNYLQNVRNDGAKKETKIISFNLLDNKLKSESNAGGQNASARYAKV